MAVSVSPMLPIRDASPRPFCCLVAPKTRALIAAISSSSSSTVETLSLLLAYRPETGDVGLAAAVVIIGYRIRCCTTPPPPAPPTPQTDARRGCRILEGGGWCGCAAAAVGGLHCFFAARSLAVLCAPAGTDSFSGGWPSQRPR